MKTFIFLFLSLLVSASALSVPFTGGNDEDEKQNSGGVMANIQTAAKVGGQVVNVAGTVGSGAMKTASALKSVTDSDAYKYLQSKGLDPISLVGHAIKGQKGTLGAAGEMMISASQGDSTFKIAQSGMRGALGPVGGVTGMLIGEEIKDGEGSLLSNSIGLAKSGYGLVSGVEEPEPEPEPGYLASAANYVTSHVG